MTHQRDIERLLDHWFSDGPDQAPGRVVDIVADRIERQSQRPAWRLPWRPFPVNAYAKISVAAAAVLLVAVIGYNLLPGRSTGVGGPAPSAPPTPSIVPSASPSAPSIAFPDWYTERGQGGLGILAAGQQTTRLFKPGLTFTVPQDWVNSSDGRELYVLFPDTTANEAEYALSRDIASAIMVANAPLSELIGKCVATGGADPGPSATAILEALAASDALIATEPVAVTIGGLDGRWIDVRLDPAWTGSCERSPEDPPTRDYKGVRDRVILLDTPEGGAVAIVIDSLYAADSDRFLVEAMPIVESFRFDVTP